MAENHRAVQELFQQALDRPAVERAAFLDSACPDAGMRAEVDGLLSAFSDAEGFLAEPEPKGPGERAGDQIDRYRLLEEIGEGGFGVVWMAEQTEPVRRRVAVKIIKLGMDTRQVVARFEAERQALALMDHPNIAKVLDGGSTPAGRPYFVMELVRGLPVTEFCDQANLDTRARLEIFQRICMAVQHAHQKGVIHRDLKPSNILVTLHDGEPVPKVIDFGVAKATTQELTQRTLFTQFRQMIGTPEYMAPEQAEMSGLDVDTRADVYSLGVILYELLTGTKPFEAQELLERGYDEMLRHMRESEPQKPSTRISTLGDRLTVVAQHRRVEPKGLGRMLRGELDWISMRALEKQRSRRYPTVRALAEDLRRFLDGDAVEAGPPSAVYRASKLLRRHRTLALTAALVVLSLLAGVIATGMALQRALASEQKEREARQLVETEKVEIERQAERAGLVVGFLKTMLGSTNPHGRRRPNMRVSELLAEFDRSATMLDQDPEVAATVRTTVGTAYRNLGMQDKAEEHLRAALELRRSTYGNGHARTADSLHEWSWLLHDRGDHQGAIESMLEALALTEEQAPGDGARIGQSLSALADFHRHISALETAFEYSDRALTILRDANVENTRMLAALEIHGIILNELGRWDEAEQIHREVIARLRTVYGPRHPRVANALAALGSALVLRGRHDDAEAAHREALEQRRELLPERHGNIASSLNNLAGVYEARGDWAKAEQYYREAIAAEPTEGVGVLITRANLGMVHIRQNEFDEAEPLFDEAVRGLEQALQPNHPTTAMIVQNQARLMELTDRLPEAEILLRRVIQMRKHSLPGDHPHHGLGHGMLGMVLHERGRTAAGDQALTHALDMMRKAFTDDHSFLGRTICHAAILKHALGQFAEAEALFTEAAEMFERLHGRKSTWAEAQVGLAITLLDQDQLTEADTAVRAVVDQLESTDSKSWQRWWANGTLGEILARRDEEAAAIPLLRKAAENFEPRRPYEVPLLNRIAAQLEKLEDPIK